MNKQVVLHHIINIINKNTTHKFESYIFLRFNADSFEIQWKYCLLTSVHIWPINIRSLDYITILSIDEFIKKVVYFTTTFQIWLLCWSLFGSLLNNNIKKNPKLEFSDTYLLTYLLTYFMLFQPAGISPLWADYTAVYIKLDLVIEHIILA